MHQSNSQRRGQSVSSFRKNGRASLAAAVAAVGVTGHAVAVTYTYTPTATTTDVWSLATNWDAAPVSATTTTLVFGSNATVFPNGFVNTNTNDITGPFSLNVLTLNGTGPSGGTATINLNGAAPSTGLNFISNGSTAPVINFNAQNGGGSLIYNLNQPLTLTNNLTVAGSTGSGTLNLLGNITATNASNLVITTPAAVTINNGTSSLATGTLQLNAANGNLTVAGGSFTALNVQNTATGAVFNQTGGTLTSQQDSRLSVSNSQWNTSGGTFNFNKMVIGANSGATNTVWTVSGNATVNQNQTGGTTNHELWVGGNNGGSGSLVVKDNAVFNAGARLNNGSYYFVVGNNSTGTGVFTIQDTAQMTWAGVAGNNSALIRVADLAGNTGTVNLNGGTLSTLGFSKGAGTGTLNANGGTIKALANSANFFNNFTGTGGNNSVNLLANGLNFNTNGFNDTVSNVLSGVGGISKSGVGTLTLTGANTYTGTTAVTAGTLLVNGVHTPAGGTPTITVAAGGVLGGIGTVGGAFTHTAGTVTGNDVSTLGTLSIGGSLTLNGGTILYDVNAANIVGSGNNVGAGDLILVNGDLAFGATPETINFNFNNPSALAGPFTYKILGYGGTLSGTPNLVYTSNLGRTQFSTVTTTPGEVAVNVTPTTGSVTWNSTGSGAWDVQTSANWFNTAANTADVYFNGDAVTFGDNNANSTPPNGQLQTTVTLAGPVSPGSVTVAANANAYTFTGPGGIAGTGTLAVNGTGPLTVLTNNAYTGGTTIAAGGTVQLGDGTGTSGTLGTGPITNNGTLIANYGGDVTLANAIGGAGSLTKNGAATLNLTAANTYTGTTTVNGGTLQLSGTGSLFGTTAVVNNGAIVASGTNTLAGNLGGAGTLTTTGTAVLSVTGDNTAFSGTTTVNTGTTLRIGNGGTTGNVPGGAVNVLGTLAFNRSDSVSVGTPLNFTGTLSQVGPAGSNVTLSGMNAVGSANVGVNTVSGVLTVPAGTSLAVGGAGTGNLSVGQATGSAASTGTLDASAAAGFTANVATVAIGTTANSGGIGTGTLKLPADSTITATTSVLVGDSGGTRNGDNNTVVATLTTAAGGTTIVNTPLFAVGSNKSSGLLTLGAGNTLKLAGIGDGGRAIMNVDAMFVGGGGGTFSGTADLSQGVINATLSSLSVGTQSYDLGSSVVNTGVMTVSTSTANHLDISGLSATVSLGGENPGVVAVGRIDGPLNTGSVNGTLTIGNLDATSSITSTNNGTAIVVGGATSGTSTGTLDLNGGTLKIATTGSAIAGGVVAGTGVATTSNVNFNGTTLVAGASSTNWIHGITNARVGSGGLAVDTNGFDIAVPQSFVSGAFNDGGLTKQGPGTLTLTSPSFYAGVTTVQGGMLKANQAAAASLLAGGGVDIAGDGAGLVLDYAGGGSPVDDVKAILTAGYGNGFATGQIRSTAHAAGRILGYGDNGVDTVTVKLTLPGDAELDGDVDFNDFLVLQNNFAQAGTRFDQANFNYDNVTDFNDFLALQNFFGQSVNGDIVAFSDAQVAAITAFAANPLNQAVPEPASLALFGLGVAGAMRRRRTK